MYSDHLGCNFAKPDSLRFYCLSKMTSDSVLGGNETKTVKRENIFLTS